MAVTLNKANLVLKDANGNIGKIEQLSNRDLAKIKTAVSDVALVVNQSNHKPIVATTTNKGVVQLATSADVVSGASDKVVTAEQLHNATIGTTSAIATSTTVGVVKPDNDTITIDSNGVLTAIKASQDKNGAQIDTTYFKSANGTFTGRNYYRDINDSLLRFNGGNSYNGGASLILFGKNNENAKGVFYLVACTKEDGSDGKQLIGKPDGTLTWCDKNIVPVTGKIEWFAFNTAPDGYLVCNGANVSRTTYANLFAVIGTTFGSGNGSTTFTLPNLIDKFAQGSTTVGTVKNAGLPNIKGTLYGVRGIDGFYSALTFNSKKLEDTYAEPGTTHAIHPYSIVFSAAGSNSIYGNSETVQPPALTLLPCIKY